MRKTYMKAVVINNYGEIDQLIIKTIDKPKPINGEVLIRVKAFGINRAEIYMRKGLWGDVARVSGIECVGVVEDDPSSTLATGQSVAAIMGGMGRTRNGSYAEFVSVPKSNVIPFSSKLGWESLAAIPESYATAWSCLHENLYLKSGDILFIRGGSSALGQAAINIAADLDNTTIIAATRNKNNIELLKEIGCSKVFIESEELSQQIREEFPDGINAVLDVVGNSTLIDSLKMVQKHGYICSAGFLGGTTSIPFNPLTDLPSTVNLNFFASFMIGTKSFPLSNIPMQEIIDKAEMGIYKSQPTQIFKFEEIQKAHQLMEENIAQGKIVITMSQ